MNKERIADIANNILEIEHESIKKRRETAKPTNKFSGVNKADSDVVNAILSLVDDGGNNED